MQRYARVVTDDPTDKELDYLIPAAWKSKVHVGSRVKVPLRNREVFATVTAILDETGAPNPRTIVRLLSEEPILNAELLRLARWMSEYYCCSVEAAIRATLPQVIRHAALGFKRTRTLRVTGARPEPVELEKLAVRAPRQAEVYRLVAEQTGPIGWSDLLEQGKTTDRTIQQLIRRGWIEVQFEAQERDPFGSDQYIPTQPIDLNLAQSAALSVVLEAIEDEDRRPILLHGVTGSGKTEIYLQAIQKCLDLGRGALVLVPEITLTPQTVERFKARFPRELVAVLHSHLSAGERHDEWYRLHRGAARVAIGARSAVFAPVQRLGLIVVDEEHEISYKQEETPRYHARDLAVVRAQMEKCAIVLGSATPSLESFHNVRTGKYRLLRLTTRVDDRRMPLIRIVDLRQEFAKTKRQPIISRALGLAVEERLQRDEQTILFLNRRGFASSLICVKCGYVCECPNCSIPLTLHLAEQRLKCHLCGHIALAPRKCPECSDPSIRFAGFGTEKVEEVVRNLFPQARLGRMDSDTMIRKDAYRQTLGAFRSRQIDILIGTQMIAKGLDFPNVTLVGIINADIGLHLPDFRAGERTFQLLTQVAGRAGRGEVTGEVFVQTSTPFSPSIQFARHHDFDGFWEQESQFRERCDYPPFLHLILVHVRSKHQRLAEFTAQTVHRRLEEQLDHATTLHPAVPAPIERTKSHYRFQILLRTRNTRRLSATIRDVLDRLTLPEDVQLAVDVDPYHLL
jgi:primosomal protein N' (replication factor Y) (superfamily II helicase)